MLRNGYKLKVTVISTCALVGVVIGGLPTRAEAQEKTEPLEQLTPNMVEALGGGDIRFAATIDGNGNIRLLGKYPMSSLTVDDPVKVTLKVEGDAELNGDSPDYLLLYKRASGDPAVVARRWSPGTVCLVTDPNPIEK